MLLLDEPLGALDLKLRRQLQVELKRIQAEVGITFVYVTHDQEEALTMSDRIAVMHAGKVEQLGTPEELYERPTTRFVADFIGSTNLLRGRIEADGWVRLDSGEIWRRSPTTGSPTGSDVETQRPAGGDRARPAERRGCHRGDRRTGRLSRHDHLISDSARRADSSLTVSTPKTGIRLPVGSDVAVTWSPSEALVLGRGPARRPADLEETTDDRPTRRPPPRHRGRTRALPDRAAA